MNRQTLINHLAGTQGLSKVKATAVVADVLEALVGSLAKGEDVSFVGFGTFKVVARKARQGRNPQDPSKSIQVPARNAVVFKASKVLKETVNAKKGKKK